MAIRALGGSPASRLGLAAYPGQDPECVGAAFEAGVNFFFFYDLGRADFVAEVARLARRNRDEVILASGSGGRDAASVERDLAGILEALDTQVVDLFFTEYVCPSDDPETIFAVGGVLDALCEMKERGAVRYAGASAHDRPLSCRLLHDGRVDVLMHRFNMAHRGALDEVFPAAAETGVPLVAFTATRWGSLMEGHASWDGDPPTAADCYRYALTQPAVELVLASPLAVAELRQDLEAMHRSPMSTAERHRWERYGDLVYGAGDDAFESRWP